MSALPKATSTTALCVGGPLSGKIFTAEGDSFASQQPQPEPDADGLQMWVSYPLVLYIRHESLRFGTLWVPNVLTAQKSRRIPAFGGATALTWAPAGELGCLPSGAGSGLTVTGSVSRSMTTRNTSRNRTETAARIEHYFNSGGAHWSELKAPDRTLRVDSKVLDKAEVSEAATANKPYEERLRSIVKAAHLTAIKKAGLKELKKEELLREIIGKVRTQSDVH